MPDNKVRIFVAKKEDLQQLSDLNVKSILSVHERCSEGFSFNNFKKDYDAKTPWIGGYEPTYPILIEVVLPPSSPSWLPLIVPAIPTVLAALIGLYAALASADAKKYSTTIDTFNSNHSSDHDTCKSHLDAVEKMSCIDRERTERIKKMTAQNAECSQQLVLCKKSNEWQKHLDKITENK